MKTDYDQWVDKMPTLTPMPENTQQGSSRKHEQQQSTTDYKKTQSHLKCLKYTVSTD